MPYSAMSTHGDLLKTQDLKKKIQMSSPNSWPYQKAFMLKYEHKHRTEPQL